MVIDQDIMTMVCLAMVDLKLTKQGFPSGQVGSHLLQAGGVVALAINRESQDMIKKIGQWSNDTFLMYIHEHIGSSNHWSCRAHGDAVPVHKLGGGNNAGQVTRNWEQVWVDFWVESRFL